MNKKLKVAIAILIILFGVATLIFFLKTKPEQAEFKLLNQISESDIAYHANLIDVLDDVIQYNSQVEKSLTNKVALNRLKDQLLKSGLENDHVYITHSFKDFGLTSVYAEILDSAAFNSTLNQLSTLLKLAPVKDSAGHYISENKKVSVEKHFQYVKLNFGQGADLALNSEKVKPSTFFIKNLEKLNNGIINTTGTSKIDSLDYATFTYSYDKELSLIIDWKVAENHPLRSNKNVKVQHYPTQLDVIKAVANIDLTHADNNLNSYLKDLSLKQFSKLPAPAQELLKLWSGQLSVQMGGKIAQETVQITTEFDEDFNQVEKRIVKVDNILNIGFYWATNQALESLELLKKLPNISIEKDKLQIALLPSLHLKTEESNIKSSTQNVDYEESKEDKLLYLNIEIEGLKGSLNIENKNQETVQLQLNLKDWKGLSNPKELDISSFW